jgi:hypothetical protein
LRYLIVTKNSDTFNNPSLDAFFKICNENRIKIYLISPSNYFPNFHSNVKVISFEYFRIFGSNSLFVSWLKKMLNCFIDLKKYLIFFYLFRFLKFNSYFGIDPSGLIELNKLKHKFKFLTPKINIVYWSFELTFSDEGATKLEEKVAVEGVTNLIIQDQVRLNLLLSEFESLRHKKTHFIPVAPYIIHDNLMNYKDLLIDDLLRVNKIMFFGGTFTKWSGSELIIELLNLGLPDNWLIFLNSRFGLSKETIVELEKYNIKKKQIYINDKYYLDFNEYISLIKKFQCAFCVYIPSDNSSYTGKNISQIGLSSGKFTSYLNAEIPIIFNKNKFYDELNEEYKFGISIELCANQLLDILKNNSFPIYNRNCIPFLDIKKSINNLLIDLN